MADSVRPAVGPADAAELCDEVYPTREEAIAIARQLRAAGWIVPLLPVPTPPTASGVRTVAIVYHPETYESPGGVTYTDRSS